MHARLCYCPVYSKHLPPVICLEHVARRYFVCVQYQPVGGAGVDVFWERSSFSAADQPGHFWAVKCSIAAGQTYVTFFWPPVFVSTLHSFTTEPKGVKPPMAATRALLIDCLEQAEGNSSAFRKSASTCERADWLTKDFFPKRDRSTIC